MKIVFATNNKHKLDEIMLVVCCKNYFHYFFFYNIVANIYKPFSVNALGKVLLLNE